MSTGTPLGFTYLQANQEQPEVPVNQNSDLIDQLSGLKVINFATDADYTVATGSSPPEWQHFCLTFTDTGVVLTTGRKVILPTKQKAYAVANATAQQLVFETAASGSVSRSLDADKVRQIFVTEAGNVFAISNQVNLTAAT